MRISEVYAKTSNSSVYKKARKWVLESKCEIKCGYCPYHKHENWSRHNDSCNWKKYRRTQYKNKAIFSGEVIQLQPV